MKCPHLTEAERRVLVAILAAHPAASSGVVARIFGSRAGRPITPASVRKRRRDGYKADPGHRHLAGPERELLAFLIEEDGGEAGWHEVARRFARLAGRPVTAQVVWHRATRVMGLPRVGKGGRARPRAADDAARAARERAEKAGPDAAAIPRRAMP